MTEKQRSMLRLLEKGKEPMEAALRAGYRLRNRGELKRLLEKPEVRRAMETNWQRQSRERMRTALERIAFGSVEEAVRFMDKGEEEFGEELFAVVELKRRENGYEVKFYDRLRAMEMLKQMEEGAETQEEGLSKALEESAKALREHGKD